MPRREKKKYHFLYKTTNLLNGKFYIGVHSTNNLEDGYLGSGKILKRSIIKYGAENFKIERLEFFENKEKLFGGEKEIVNEFLLIDPSCMNLVYGGKGGWEIPSDPNLQKRRNEKGNEKIRWLIKNNPEWVQKRHKNMSKGQKESYENGREIIPPPNWSGKKHRDSSKEKIGKSNSIKQKGSFNSQFGTCWITNGKENKKINKRNLIPDGWKYGRKMASEFAG